MAPAEGCPHVHGPASLSEALHTVLRWGPIVQMGKPRLGARELVTGQVPAPDDVGPELGKAVPMPRCCEPCCQPGLLGQFCDVGSRVQTGTQEGQQIRHCHFCQVQPYIHTWRCPSLNTPVGGELTTTLVARCCYLMWDFVGLRLVGPVPVLSHDVES